MGQADHVWSTGGWMPSSQEYIGHSNGIRRRQSGTVTGWELEVDCAFKACLCCILIMGPWRRFSSMCLPDDIKATEVRNLMFWAH